MLIPIKKENVPSPEGLEGPKDIQTMTINVHKQRYANCNVNVNVQWKCNSIFSKSWWCFSKNIFIH